MKKASILDSFIGTALRNLRTSDYLSPDEPVGRGETVVDDMSDFERGLYTLSQLSRFAIENILDGTTPGSLSYEETVKISRHANIGRLCIDLLRTSMELRLPYSDKKTVFEIRSDFKIVEKKIRKEDVPAPDGPKTFALCSSRQPVHAHFYDENGMVLSDPLYSKAEARMWLASRILRDIVPDEDKQRELFETIETVQLPPGNDAQA